MNDEHSGGYGPYENGYIDPNDYGGSSARGYYGGGTFLALFLYLSYTLQSL